MRPYILLYRVLYQAPHSKTNGMKLPSSQACEDLVQQSLPLDKQYTGEFHQFSILAYALQLNI